MGSPDPSHDSFPSDSCDQWDPYDDSFDAFDAPSQLQTQTNELKLCRLPDWDSERTYDESYIRYSIVWKVTVNNRAIIKPDTEQDLVLAPAGYWQRFLHPKLQQLLQTKNRSLRSEDTSVVVSVTQRKEDPLTKRFDDTNIDWAVIESQLVAWGRFYRAGKKLRLNLSFNYIDTANTSSRKGDKRGSSSTTRQMLATGALQVDAEQHSTGQSSIWRRVYELMRCPGRPCDKGPHCWCDPVGKKHYKLYTPHMTALVEYMQDGNTLQTHDDVPEDIRRQLYDEEKKSLERHKKTTTPSAASLPPINITVLPAPAGTPAPDMPSKSTPNDRLDIPGYLDEQVEDYFAWHQSRVKKRAWKEDYEKAYDVMIKHGKDLDQIRWNPNPKFLIDEGVLEGTAERVVSDVDYWFETTKRRRTEE
jgi:hypothetical protein